MKSFCKRLFSTKSKNIYQSEKYLEIENSNSANALYLNNVPHNNEINIQNFDETIK
jgi:hypothetical protein